MAIDTDEVRAQWPGRYDDAAVVNDLCDEIDRLRAALADIAAGECGDLVRPPCPPDDRCDVCTARAALEGQEVAP